MYDPNYKLRHKVQPVYRLPAYKWPLPMVGDPPIKNATRYIEWPDRCRAVYEHMMSIRRGIVPPAQRHGLWFYAETPTETEPSERST